jgi:3-deoxy-D-manno-octulosonate 8-phosphate phosphatase KdsC-like HAD superfamily phosphatase
MDQLLEKMGLTKENVAAVGDTVVDLPMFERAGLSIAVNTNQSDVFENTNYHHNGDLRELINIISTW